LDYKIIGASKKFKNQLRPLVRPGSVNFCQNFWNLSHETVPFRQLYAAYPSLPTSLHSQSESLEVGANTLSKLHGQNNVNQKEHKKPILQNCIISSLSN
jgi:hypothetical protein